MLKTKNSGCIENMERPPIDESESNVSKPYLYRQLMIKLLDQ